MSDVAMTVEGLSKRYRIGQYVGGGAYQYRALRDVLTDAMHAPFHRLRARSKQRAVASNPTADSHQLSAISHQPSANFIWALKDVSFEVKQGDVVGIIGRNGAGKTTLLRVLSRITEPTEGRAEIKGRVRSLLEVGTGFHPELTGRENIYLSGAILGMTKKEIDRKFDEIVDFSGVEKFIHTPIKRYSSGMLVRLGFAVAAHLESEILLVDEVLAVGDIEFQKKCLSKMGHVAREGRTVLFVSHNMGAITRLCERAVFLEGGQLIADGPAFQVAEQYHSGHLTNRAHWECREPLRASSEFSFISATARDEDGKACSIFRADRPIRMELVYEVNRPLSGCQVCTWFINSMGVQVLYTGDSDSQNVSAVPRVPGRYRTQFMIPGHFLATGHYTVSFSAHLPARVTYDEVHEIIALEVSHTGSLESLDTRKPVVAPLFVWHTNTEG